MDKFDQTNVLEEIMGETSIKDNQDIMEDIKIMKNTLMVLGSSTEFNELKYPGKDFCFEINLNKENGECMKYDDSRPGENVEIYVAQTRGYIFLSNKNLNQLQSSLDKRAYNNLMNPICVFINSYQKRRLDNILTGLFEDLKKKKDSNKPAK